MNFAIFGIASAGAMIGLFVASGVGLMLGLSTNDSSDSGGIEQSAYEGGGPGGGSGQTLTAAQVAQYAQAAGIPNEPQLKQDNPLVIAVAIAQAESSFNPGNVNKGSDARGLWQILTSAHPNRDPNQEFNATYNAQSMAIISDEGRNWTPWQTYTNGAYQRFLPEAEQAVNGTSL
jgi:hypothetical protein